jgi:VanZ family protein
MLTKDWWANKPLMHFSFFSENSFIKKRARFIAILWALLILFLCFIPSNEIPKLNVPLADKWVHFILFGSFCFFWLLSLKKTNLFHFFFWIMLTAVFGWLVEELQGLLSFLGRSKENMDIVADAVGGVLGAFLFFLLHKKTNPSNVS